MENEIVIISSLLSSTFIIGLAKAYSGVLGLHLDAQEIPLKSEIKNILKEALSIMMYSQIPSFFFILSALKLITLRFAFTLSLSTAPLSLFLFGLLYGKLQDKSRKKTLVIGLLNATFGLAIIGLHTLIH